jgi:hypothetical protein
MVRQPFGHLAAAGIVRAEKQDFYHHQPAFLSMYPHERMKTHK